MNVVSRYTDSMRILHILRPPLCHSVLFGPAWGQSIPDPFSTPFDLVILFCP